MNLYRLGFKKAWEIINEQTLEFTGKSYDQMIQEVGEDESIYYNKLSDELKEWVTNQIDEGTETFMEIQAATMDLKSLLSIILEEIGDLFPNGIPDEQIGWAWYLLYSEQ